MIDIVTRRLLLKWFLCLIGANTVKEKEMFFKIGVKGRRQVVYWQSRYPFAGRREKRYNFEAGVIRNVDSMAWNT